MEALQVFSNRDRAGFSGCLSVDEPGFIQLTLDDVAKLIGILTQWKEEGAKCESEKQRLLLFY